MNADVSRETAELLERYVETLRKWNRKINLVSRSTEADIWNRHVADSIQLWDLKPVGVRSWADLGSGAGLPGLIIAIVAKSEAPEMVVHLVEADSRKCAFLHTVATNLDLNVYIHTQRIEELSPLNADVISARALAPLPDLLAMAKKHRREAGICLFPKGEAVHKEIEAARKLWTFACISHPSKTSAASAILEIGAIERDRAVS